MRDTILAEREKDAVTLVTQMTKQGNLFVQDIKRQLLTLSLTEAVAEQDVDSTNALFSNLVAKDYSYYYFMGLANIDGQVIASSPLDAAPKDISDQQYFQNALSEKHLIMSSYMYEDDYGMPYMVFAYPVLNNSYQVQSVLLAGLKMTWMQDYIDGYYFAEQANVLIYNENGDILSNINAQETQDLMWFPEDFSVELNIDRKIGQMTTRGMDGVERLYVFGELDIFPTTERSFVTVGIPTEVLSALNRDLMERDIVGTASMMLLFLFIIWIFSGHFILKPIHSLVEKTQLLATGKLNEPVSENLIGGTREIKQLAKAFDDMAETIQLREENLRETEAKFRTLIESTPSITFMADIDDVNQVFYVSPQVEEFTGIPYQEWLEMPWRWRGRVYEEDRDRVMRELDAITPMDRRMHIDYRIQHQDGSIHWVEETLSLVEDNDGSPLFFQGIIFDVTERKESEAQNKQQLERLRSLRRIDRAISGSMDMLVTYDVILDQVTHQLDVDAADILIYDPYTHSLRFGAGRGFETDQIQKIDLPIGEPYAGQVVAERRMIAVPDLAAADDIICDKQTICDEHFVSYYGVPLIAKGRVLGVLEVFHRAAFQVESDWIEFLQTLAGQAAIAINNSELFNNLQRSNTELTLAYDNTLGALAASLELRDHETEGHCRRVTSLTVKLAEKLGMSREELTNVRRGALLHDIGKLGVPDSILLKPGKLTEEEWVIMRKHPVFAYQLLSPISFLRPALAIPYYHHEKWDGTGYPRGLKGEDIPLAARIFAIIDVWDALTSDRPYRKAVQKIEVIQLIREQSGKHFDPEIVDAFIELISQNQAR
jgi:PAS domain S-box-containing protein